MPRLATVRLGRDKVRGLGDGPSTLGDVVKRAPPHVGLHHHARAAPIG